MSIFVVMGAWLSDDYGLSVAGLGAIATGIGAAELASSSAVAVAADRIGIRRSVGIGGLLLGLGLVVIALSNDSVIIALIGLIVLVIGFEYGFVSSLSLMSEAAPQARGTASRSETQLRRSPEPALSSFQGSVTSVSGFSARRPLVPLPFAQPQPRYCRPTSTGWSINA